MTPVVRLIAEHASWLFMGCAIGAVAFLAMFVRARRSLNRSLFGLEMEIAIAHRQRALRLLLLTAILAAGVFLISTVIEPGLEATPRIQPTPTVNLFATPPPTFSAQTPFATASITITLDITSTALPLQPTAGLAPTREASPETPAAETPTSETPSPTAPPTPAEPSGEGCAITFPADGAEATGAITFLGTATANQFLFFKMEAYGPETNGAWASILGDVSTSPVVNGVLGTSNFTGWAPGGYSIRLTIVDTTHNEVSTCFLRLTIVSP